MVDVELVYGFLVDFLHRGALGEFVDKLPCFAGEEKVD